MSAQWFNVGKIVNTHGIRGELKIWPQTDFPEQRFKKGSLLYIFQEDKSQPVEVKVESSRLHKNTYIMKLQGYNNINEVEKFKGAMLKIGKEQRGTLAKDEYYYDEIIGCIAVTEDGAELGPITEILTPGANHVWVVTPPKGKGKPILLPVIDPVILDVNVAEKRITVHLMEGLV